MENHKLSLIVFFVEMSNISPVISEKTVTAILLLRRLFSCTHPVEIYKFWGASVKKKQTLLKFPIETISYFIATFFEQSISFC